MVKRFNSERSIYYDHNKIDFLYAATERSFECDKLAEMVIDRLRALEQIHKDSPNVAQTFETVAAK